MKTQNVVVDIGNLKASDIFFVQGEKGREITFKVINSLLEDFVNLDGYTATIHILKSDGNFTIDNMTIDTAKSECYYTLTENDCACGGRGFYDLSFSKNNELIYTAHGDFIGDFRSVNDDSVNSVSSAYGVTFPEGFQEKLIEGDNIRIINNVISALGKEYHGGTGIDINNDLISIEESVLTAIANKQDILTAGDNISIEDNIISSKGIDIITEHFGSGDNTLYRTFTLPDERIPKFFIIKGYMDAGWFAEVKGMFGDTVLFGSCSDILPYNQQLGGNVTVSYDMANKQFTIHGYNTGYTFNTSTSNFDIIYIYF